MVDVNPPPHVPIPAKISSDPQLRPYFQALHEILFQLWRRTGGQTDTISNSEELASDVEQQLAAFRGEFARLARRDTEIQPVDANIPKLLKRVESLERDTPIQQNLSHILKRLEALEAQI